MAGKRKLCELGTHLFEPNRSACACGRFAWANTGPTDTAYDYDNSTDGPEQPYVITPLGPINRQSPYARAECPCPEHRTWGK